MALQAAHVVGLDLAGVDLIRTPKKTSILEINPFPGLDGISTTLGQDFGLMIARSLEKSH